MRRLHMMKKMPRLRYLQGCTVFRPFALKEAIAVLLLGFAGVYSFPAGAGEEADLAGKEASVTLGDPVSGDALATESAGFGIRSEIPEQGMKSAVILWDEVLPSKPPKPGNGSSPMGNIRITINK